MNIESMFFNNIIPGSINFGLELLYSDEDMPWNKKLLKKKQMINEKLIESASIEKVLIKNQRIFEAETKREQDLYLAVKEMDKAIEKLIAEKGKEDPSIQEWIKMRSYLEIEEV